MKSDKTRASVFVCLRVIPHPVFCETLHLGGELSFLRSQTKEINCSNTKSSSSFSPFVRFFAVKIKLTFHLASAIVRFFIYFHLDCSIFESEFQSESFYARKESCSRREIEVVVVVVV